MKELGISINKILKDWLQSNGEGDIVFTDDIAINEVTDEIVTECRAKYDELLQQRDELREALRGAIGIIRTWHGIGIIDEAKEADMWRIYSSHAPEMKKLIAAIKNTDG